MIQYDSIWFLSELHNTSHATRVITFSLRFFNCTTRVSPGFCTKWHLKDDPKTQDQQKEAQQIRVSFESKKHKTTIDQFPSKKNTHIIMSLPFHKSKKQKQKNERHETSRIKFLLANHLCGKTSARATPWRFATELCELRMKGVR